MNVADGWRGIERARDTLRASGKPGTVVLSAGDYFLEHTIDFDRRDPQGAVYRGDPGARLIGGVRIRQWRKSSHPRLAKAARGHVMVADVRGLGEFRKRGFGRDSLPAHSELFFNGRRMTVARWPNKGFTRIAEPVDTVMEDDGHGGKIGRLPLGFRYDGDRPSTWKADPNIWVHGYWAWDWADSFERVASIDSSSRAVITAPPHGIYGFRKGQRFYFLNVLEELDEPGEYWLDFKQHRVYFWPPEPVETGRGEAFLSQIEQPLVRIIDARGIRLEGLTITAGRAEGVVIEGGEGVVLRGLRVENMGNSGVAFRRGQRHAVENCHVAYTGESAVEISGGDRKTLTPGGHRVENSDIHHMGQWVSTYTPAVRVAGVGHTVAHNAIHDAPHAGILLNGNDHVIEYNDMHHLAQETGDVGAIYIGRDYTERGVVIRYNYLHELGGVGLGSMAVYLDDCASGAAVYGNLFYKLKYGVFVGGGRDNRVENNVFVECNPAIHVDARGLDPRPVWQNMVYQNMKQNLDAVPIDQAPWPERYPQIQTVVPYFRKPGGVPPENNVIRGNLIQGKSFDIREPAKPFVTAPEQSNTVVDDPDFFDPQTRRIRVPAGVRFEPLPVDKIGPATLAP